MRVFFFFYAVSDFHRGERVHVSRQNVVDLICTARVHAVRTSAVPTKKEGLEEPCIFALLVGKKNLAFASSSRPRDRYTVIEGSCFEIHIFFPPSVWRLVVEGRNRGNALFAHAANAER